MAYKCDIPQFDIYQCASCGCPNFDPNLLCCPAVLCYSKILNQLSPFPTACLLSDACGTYPEAAHTTCTGTELECTNGECCDIGTTGQGWGCCGTYADRKYCPKYDDSNRNNAPTNQCGNNQCFPDPSMCDSRGGVKYAACTPDVYQTEV